MSRHLRQQFRHHYRIGTVDIEGYFTVVDGTPVTVSVTNCPGVTSVTRSDTGNFTVNFDNKVRNVVKASVTHQPATGAILLGIPSTLSEATRKAEAQAGTFKFDLRTEAGTETDPLATDLIWFSATVVISAAGDR